MLQLLILHLVVAVIAPACVDRWGRRFFLVLALVPGSAAVWAATKTSAVLAGDVPSLDVTWVPSLGMDLTFRLDTLAWLMVLIVGGIGALVLVYCASYFSATAKGLGRFAGVFIAFAGTMLGLVTTDNTLVLYVFWELTSVTSFLLIGHSHDRQNSRRAAVKALIVTTMGGLAMLAGLVALGVVEGGSYSISELVSSPPGGPVVPAAIALVLLGAVTKSAMIPFHFWLPAAMAAPTPVSAYLHAAAMVKAGVYLVARLAPGFADLPLWRWSVLLLGGGTLILGGYRALRQHDLKLLLAFGTVSQLGLIIMLVGFGTEAVALAGVTMIASHALFKACLFLCVGTIDWSVGTRDLRELSGLGRRMPFVTVCAAVATASMVGLPPLLGYVAKESALEALLADPDGLARASLVLLVVGSVLTFGYGLRFMWGAFATKAGVTEPASQRTSRLIVAPIAVLAAASLAVGLLPATTERLLEPFTATFPGEPGHLTLWGGFGMPVVLTLVIVAGGVLLFLGRDQVERLQDSFGDTDGAEGAYRRSIRGLENLAADVTALTQRGSLPNYLSIILVVLVALAGGAAIATGSLPEAVRAWDSRAQAAVVVVICIAAFLTARARRRLKAVLLLGVSGYGVALLYELHGAPDLALTQVLVETITLVVFILVLRRLPAYFSNRPLAVSRWWRAGLGVVSGVVVAGVTVVAAGSRQHAPVSVDFAEEAYEYGYGRNIVNVTLVDIRAWDTMGEISVLLAAATGVASLIFLRSRSGKIDRASRLAETKVRPQVWPSPVPDRSAALRQLARTSEAPSEPLRAPGRNREWLSAGGTLSPQRRSVIFEVGVRMVFHTMLVFSLFLLLAGHNSPGGGFAGGLIAGIALTVRYLAGGRYELGEAAPVQAGWVLGSGLFLATGAGAIPLLFGGDVLQSAVFDVDLGVYGELHLVTTLFFDIGVYLVVVGLVLDILRTLGAEVDRQGELEGSAAPDVAHDSPMVAADDAAPEAVAAPVPSGGGR